MSIFSQVQVKKHPYSTFNLSHQRKFSMNMGDLIPCMVIETIPADRFRCQTAQLVRLAPIVAPIMHQISIYTHFFYVPNRIIWDGWEEFISPDDGSSVSNFPFLEIGEEGAIVSVNSLSDYLGIPISYEGPVNALPFAGLNMVYNEFFRDQNLIPKVTDTLIDSENAPEPFMNIHKRSKQHDYFTSALPFTQRGPEVTVPLGNTAPVQYSDPLGHTLLPAFKRVNTGASAAGAISAVAGGLPNDGTSNVYLDPGATLVADLSQATASTIVDLRNAFRLQEFFELQARAGARYPEFIKANFNVDIGDGTINRPIFLGGGSQPLTISEVLQTSASGQTGASTPQGNMSGHGISAGQSSSWSYKCKEHGFILGLISVMPKTAYQDGLAKFWFKNDRFDFFFRQFAHIGEQPILNKEVYWSGAPSDEDVFGYTPRYAEYKYINDSVHGEFRTTLDIWHLGIKFSGPQNLNQQFIEWQESETNRIFANTAGEQLYVHMYHSIKVSRQMPYFGNPNI